MLTFNSKWLEEEGSQTMEWGTVVLVIVTLISAAASYMNEGLKQMFIDFVTNKLRPILGL